VSFRDSASEIALETPLSDQSNAKRLIIHADDLGMAHSINRAIFLLMHQNTVTSASVMVPCPWFMEVVLYAEKHPRVDFGIHLTLTSEWENYRWRPISPGDRIPSLIDAYGFLRADLSAEANVEEIETEVRAQIDFAIRAGLRPTHLDSHMATLFRSRPLFEILQKVGLEYGLPVRGERVKKVATIDERTKARGWAEYYANVLSSLALGLSELIVHPGFDDAELRAVTGGQPNWGAAWRQRDLDVLMSPEFKALLKHQAVLLVNAQVLKGIAT
jgi:predicted glycoside hydrolase/deacetylase ChbG (UPF0249 family)